VRDPELRHGPALPAPQPLTFHGHQRLLLRATPRGAPAFWQLQLLPHRQGHATAHGRRQHGYGQPRTAQVRVYALNYNVLRVMSGMVASRTPTKRETKYKYKYYRKVSKTTIEFQY